MNQQKKLFAIVGAIVVVALIVVVGGFNYVYATGGNGKASAPISAPAVAVNSANSASTQTFAIDSSKSKVSFTLTEDLLGKANTVVGTTTDVAGNIVVDVDQPANSQLGTIRIDARTLATDSSMRDRMMRSQILSSSEDQYEYIDFVPTALTGLPAKIVAGQSYTFQAAGNLTVRSLTKAVTFDITATLVGGTTNQLQGTATSTIKRSDFNLTIPNVPSVANVSDEVKLAIDFVAPTSTASTATQAATASAAS